MKYITISTLIIALVIIVAGAGNFAVGSQVNSTSFLRIHIRANSNELSDQMVKYEIKNALVDMLSPTLSKCDTKLKVINALEQDLTNLEGAINDLLKNKNFNYKAKVKLNREYFPTRSYDEYVLDSGVYDALIVELGEAVGNNWWCVVYPPLCFINPSATGAGLQYKSKLLEIIQNFFKK